MIGDPEDMRARLRLTLPAHWYSDVAPVLDGLLAGLASAWSWLYSLLQVARSQSRLRTTTAEFLDLAAVDYFGTRVGRRISETDDAFRSRLQRLMQRKRATRQSLVDAAYEVGFTLAIFEPAQPADTGAYNINSGLAWNACGGWGSLEMPLECLVTASPSQTALDDALMPTLAESLPAGAAAWVRITG